MGWWRVTDEPVVDYTRLRYIKLRGDGSKLPAESWGGYDQDFDDADHVHTHDEVEMLPADNWGIVDIKDKESVSFALLIFDIDVHKAPEDFDADRVGVPTDTLVTRSQNGGFHAYFAVSGAWRGDLSESDFQMTAGPGFDVDIRGSIVSHHVVAPAEIPGVGGPYEIVNDEGIAPVMDPGDAAERITLDGEPLVEFNSDGGVEGYDFDVPTDPPEDMPTCYHAGLELRKAAPDDHPNTHKVNMLTAACGLAAGYDPEDVAGHFCGEWSPHDGGADLSDKEQTEYQVRQIERNGYAPPSESTLRGYGILDDDQHCEDCPIDYHPPGNDSSPTLDVVAEMDDGRDPQAEAAAVAGADEAAAETDGGTAAASSDSSPRRSFNDDVRQAIREFNDEVIQAKTARHRIAQALVDHFHFVYPEEEVRDWRSTLYVYNKDEGLYEPRGVTFIEDKLEYAAGDFTTNQVTNEIVEKVRRMSTARDREFERHPERLAVGNGILNLHTGELSNYSPHEYHTTKIDIDWNPDAGDPEEIDRFLHDIVEDGDVTTLYRLVAHTLYKEYIGEKAAMLIGGGSNGKSMFLSLIEDFVGSYNVVHRELQDFGEDMYALNNLQGKLANLATEIGEQELDDTTAFKKATGRDTIDAPVKYERPITFENYATLMFATNEMPVFGQDNHAIWRRWVYVDFPYTFDADDPDAKDPEPERVIERRIKRDEEFEALLLRCQQEIQRWYEGEPLFADAMDPDDVRDKMKKAAEPVYAFASTCLEATGDDEDYVQQSVVRACYRAFADEEDLPRIADNEFGRRLHAQRDLALESGQKRIDGSRASVYKRVQLSSRGRQVLGIDEPEDNEQGGVDDDYDQARPAVVERVREMFEENGNEPVPKSGVTWSLAGDIGQSTAENILDQLITDGDVIEMSGDRVAPN